MSSDTAPAAPTLVEGLTSAEIAGAMPELGARLGERAREQATSWGRWLADWLDAWNRFDPDAVLALMADDVVLRDPGLCGEHLVGKDGLRAAVTTTLRAFPDVRWEIAGSPHLAVLGTGVAVPWRMRGTFGGDLGGGPSPLGIAGTGRRFDTTGVDVYDLRDGLLVSWTSTFDLLDLGRQFGMMPDPRSRLFRWGVRAQRLIAPLLRAAHR